MCSVSARSEVQTCFPILPHTLQYRHTVLHRGNTHIHSHRKPNPLFICFYLSCIVCCAAVQTFQMKTCHIDAEELGIVEGSCSTCAQWQPPTPPCPLQCSYCCLRVYGHAYGLLLAFSPFNPFPLLSPPLSLVKGLKCTGLFAASSRLLYSVCVYMSVCVRARMLMCASSHCL